MGRPARRERHHPPLFNAMPEGGTLGATRRGRENRRPLARHGPALIYWPFSPVTFTNPNIQSLRKCTRLMHSTR
jgi:hypothetical protein